MSNINKDNQQQNFDENIGKMFLKKTTLMFSSNLFLPLFLMFSGSIVSFFTGENSSTIKYGIGVFGLLIYIYIYISRNKTIISSVGLYKYSEIFSEILKNIVFQKKYLRNAKSIWKQIK